MKFTRKTVRCHRILMCHRIKLNVFSQQSWSQNCNCNAIKWFIIWKWENYKNFHQVLNFIFSNKISKLPKPYFRNWRVNMSPIATLKLTSQNGLEVTKAGQLDNRYNLYLTMNQVYWIILTYSTVCFVFPLISYKQW